MTCGLHDGIEVSFLNSGLTVTPYEVTTRSNEAEFSYTKTTVSREDGNLITDDANEFEPVELKLDGVVQDRYMYHPEAVDLHNDSATLTLYDAEKILEKGTVNKHFQNTSLRDVIEFIVNGRQDPQKVILGIKHPSEAVQDAEVFNEGQFGTGGWIGGAIGAGTDLLELMGNPEASDTSLKLKKMTPFEALKKTADSFALQTWVDTDGYLNYGLRGLSPTSHTIKPDDDGIRLKGYNITVGSGKLDQLVVRGRYKYITNNARTGPTEITSPEVYAYGKVWLGGSGDEGRSIEPTNIGATSPKEAEDTARRLLLQHYMGRKNGNLVINAGASTDKEKITGLSVGDLIAAGAEIETHCEREIDTGIFLVQSVKHDIDRRNGWMVTVEVAGIPTTNISSESWLENPSNDQRWDSVDEYGASDFGS